ncbi:MAG: pilus assembly protein TadG-related protein [Acidobacteriaceae bacterium]
MRCRGEEGQAVIAVAVAMSIFLVAAIGLGVDGSHLYAQRQMAQTAADAAALSAIQSVFDGTYNVGTNPARFTLATFTCGTTDARTPCVYASNNGFGPGTPDTVTMSFPGAGTITGVSLATGFPALLAKATVSRNVSTTLLRFLGSTATTVTATATAAIVSVVAPVPIIVNHPTLPSSFAGNGNVGVTICGGPHRSIQVNSSNGAATSTSGSSNLVNLTHAGPPDTGNCLTGNGADFGVTGGPTGSSSFTVSYGSTGQYVDKTSFIPDPLASVVPPTLASLPTPKAASLLAGAANAACPAGAKKPCKLFYPGIYPTGIDGKNLTPIMAPGIYYIQGTNGLDCTANCNMYMATGITDTGTGTTNTGWDGTAAGGGVMFYNTGTGVFNLGSNGNVSLIGAPPTGPYKGILFFQDRTAAAATHSLGGGGAMTLIGTIYMTNTRATMLGTSAHYQELDLQGGPGSSTNVNGEIIVDSLQLGGNANITMNLNNPSLTTSQIALVN